MNYSPYHVKVPSGNEYDAMAYCWKEKYLINNSAGLTHRQIKERLTQEYPDCILVKEIAYHEGARWRGNKKGSQNKHGRINYG